MDGWMEGWSSIDQIFSGKPATEPAGGPATGSAEGGAGLATHLHSKSCREAGDKSRNPRSRSRRRARNRIRRGGGQVSRHTSTANPAGKPATSPATLIADPAGNPAGASATSPSKIPATSSTNPKQSPQGGSALRKSVANGAAPADLPVRAVPRVPDPDVPDPSAVWEAWAASVSWVVSEVSDGGGHVPAEAGPHAAAGAEEAGRAAGAPHRKREAAAPQQAGSDSGFFVFSWRGGIRLQRQKYTFSRHGKILSKKYALRLPDQNMHSIPGSGDPERGGEVGKERKSGSGTDKGRGKAGIRVGNGQKSGEGQRSGRGRVLSSEDPCRPERAHRLQMTLKSQNVHVSASVH